MNLSRDRPGGGNAQAAVSYSRQGRARVKPHFAACRCTSLTESPALTEQLLTIQGERRPAVEEPEGFYRSELAYGRFYREFQLPESVKTDEISASFENGVLEITLPAPQREKGRKIEIR